MKYNYGLYFGSCLLAATLVCGCGNVNSNNIPQTGETAESTSIVDDLTETESVSEVTDEEEQICESDAIIIDRIGYRQFCNKRVYILGNDLKQTFELRDENTGKTVFNGSLKVVDDKDYNGLNLYLGDFSDYKLKGDFRIYQEDIGKSHLFSISSSRYKDEFEEAYNILVKKDFAQTEEELYVLSNMLMTKDIYDTTYINKRYIDEKVSGLLELQNPETGAVQKDHINIEESPDAGIAATYAGVMAQYSILFGEESPELAAKCIDSAAKAFSYMDRNGDNLDSDLYYFAASELYRATGQYIYRSAIEKYDALETNKSYSDYNYLFAADLAYLNTNYRTDYKRSQSIMKYYQDAAEAISVKVDKNHFNVQKDMDKLSDDQILNNMQKMGLVSYVVSGHEYAILLENYIHYLDGTNVDSMFVLTDSGELSNDLETEDALKLSKLLFSLGHLYNS